MLFKIYACLKRPIFEVSHLRSFWLMKHCLFRELFSNGPAQKLPALTMLKSLLIIGLFCASTVTFPSEEQLSESHKALIEELVALVGDMETFKVEVRNYHHELMFLPVEKMFAGTILEDDPEVLEVMRETIDSVIDWEFSEGTSLKKIHYQSFATDISENELQALITFYRTDLGKKVLGTKAGLFKEWETNRNIWGRSLQSDIRRKVGQRLDEYHKRKLEQIEDPSER